MKIEVYAPASSGNFAVGFDLLGAALAPVSGALLGDIVSVEAIDAPHDEFVCSGRYAEKLAGPKESNLAYQCLQHFKEHVCQTMPTCRLELKKNLPVGSGLGSSACSVVAAFAALNIFAETALSQAELLTLMADFEEKVSGGRHYDNIAPCYLGGLQLCGDLLPGHSLAIPTDDNWQLVVAYPGFALNTAKARQVLPGHYSMHTTIDYAQRLSGFTALCFTGQFDGALGLMRDELAEPYRESLITGFSDAKAALLAMGVDVVAISGAGPTLLALTKSPEIAQQANQWLEQHYINQHGFSHICKIDQLGTRQLAQGVAHVIA
jgi:homoserine kinase